MKKKNDWDEDEEDEKKEKKSNDIYANIETYFLQDDLNKIQREYRVDMDYVKKLRSKHNSIKRKVFTTTQDSFYFLRDKWMRLHCQEYYDKFT